MNPARWIGTARTTTAGVMLAVVIGTAGWLMASSSPAPDASPAADGVLVGPVVLEAALASRAPDRLTLSDEVAHFEARLVGRGDERFAHARLSAAHLLRFRAYGRAADLAAAEDHARVAGRGEGASAMSASIAGRRAALHLARHEFSEALEAAVAAHDLAGGREPGHALRLFDALWATGRFEAAEAMLGPPLDPESVGVLSRRARVLDRMGEVERARDHFRAVLRRVRAYSEPAPVVGWALVELGRFEHHAGDPERAVQLYLEALDVLPGSPAALEALAAVAFGVDRDPAAAASLLRHALAQGAHLDVMPTLADIEEARGAREAAERVRTEFIRLATTDARSERLYRRPLAFVLANDPATVRRALAYARLDLEDRRDPGAWDALAWVRYRAGDVAGAWRAARLATIGGAPEPAMAWRAGVIGRASGDRARSDELLQMALEAKTELTPAQVEEARRLLGLRKTTCCR